VKSHREFENCLKLRFTFLSPFVRETVAKLKKSPDSGRLSILPDRPMSPQFPSTRWSVRQFRSSTPHSLDGDGTAPADRAGPMTVGLDRRTNGRPSAASLRLQTMHLPTFPDGPGKVGEDKATPSWPPRDALERRFGVGISINLFVPYSGVFSESPFFKKL
jgi:hypothetical protein